MYAEIKMRRRVRTDLLLVALFVVIFGSGYVEIRAGQSSKPHTQQPSSQEKLEAEQRLWDLGYWAGPVDGKFDGASRHALIAFQKVERRARTGILTLNELNALRAANRPLARHGKFGHVEIDLERQVLFLIDETGAVMRVLPISTGSGKLYVDQGRVQRARTPTGTFKVLRKIKGWRLSTLGLLYYPNYIVNGIAVHGSPSVPSRPASHGCIRVPMFAAKELSGLLPVGMQVEVYDGKT